jgi:hypothetical protein
MVIKSEALGFFFVLLAVLQLRFQFVDNDIAFKINEAKLLIVIYMLISFFRFLQTCYINLIINHLFRSHEMYDEIMLRKGFCD